MPSKNDLSALKDGSNTPKILPKQEPVREERSESPKTAVSSNRIRRVGRPKKKPSEKRDYKITVSLTAAEGAKIREKAGLASDATYLHAMLERAGVFK